MSDDEQRQVDAIERERRRREAALLALLLLFVSGSAVVGGTRRTNRRNAMRFAVDAVHVGHAPAAVIRDVILGAPTLHLPGVVGPLTQSLAEAWEAGYRRAFTLADEPQRDTTTLYQGGQYATLQRAARDAARTLYEYVAKVAEDALTEAREAKLTTPQAAAAVADAFTRYGLTAASPATIGPAATGAPAFALASRATDLVLSAWAAGYGTGTRHPSVLVKLTALRHRSILDERTSKYCDADSGRDGLTLKPSDPYWRTNWPPLHFGCRSVVLPIFRDDVTYSDDRPAVAPMPGFGLAPGGPAV